jgi:hypothetical protein
VLSTQGIQETLDQAVANGRMLRRDAEDVTRGLVEAGRRQTQLVVADIEQLLGRGRSERGGAAGTISGAAGTIGGAAGTARALAGSAAEAAGDRVLREVDRARRVARVGPAFPILNYEDLTAEQVIDRLGDLTPAELRKVRDHERRGRDRTRVLDAIGRALK